MNATVKFVLVLILLIAVAPLVITWVNELIVPFVVVVVVLLLGRLVWFHTHL